MQGSASPEGPDGGAVPVLRSERLAAPELLHAREPFPWLIATDVLASSAAPALRSGFPVSAEAGFIPHSPDACGAEFNRLVAAVTAPECADRIGDLLGVPQLSAFPVLVTICSRLNRRHGTIHADSRSKVASALLYLNEEWTPGSAGCLRLLARGDDLDALVVPEIPPVFGTLVAFRRCDRSFHGHLPYEGERRAIQFAWLIDSDALARKRRRGRMQRLVKRLFGPVDRWLGARRGVDEAHRD